MADERPLAKGLTQVTAESSDWKSRFLLGMRDSPTVRAACEKAGVSRVTAYRHRAEDPEFAAAWDAAIEEAVDKLESALFKRAEDTDTTAAIFILKNRRPEIYSDKQRVEVTGVDGGPVLLAAVIADRARLAADLDPDPAEGTPGDDHRDAIAGDLAGADTLPGAPVV